MANELMNMATIKEKISERVKTTFFELLPEDKFNELIDAEIKTFFEATIEQFEVAEIKLTSSGYNSPTTYHNKLTTAISPFRSMVWHKCKSMVDAKLNNIFAEEGFGAFENYYNNQDKTILTGKLEDMLRNQANELAKNFFTTMFAQAFNTVAPQIIQETKNQIRNGY